MFLREKQMNENKEALYQLYQLKPRRKLAKVGMRSCHFDLGPVCYFLSTPKFRPRLLHRGRMFRGGRDCVLAWEQVLVYLLTQLHARVRHKRAGRLLLGALSHLSWLRVKPHGLRENRKSAADANRT